MLRMSRGLRRSKKLRRQPRPDRRARRGRQADRNLVSRRGPDRTKEQDHPAMGAARDARPSTPHDQRTRSAYIFGAICPAQGIAAGPVLPRCNTAAMALHLAEISRTVTPGAHAVLLLDQAGWHLSAKLDIPDNITLVPLPPKSPELNPVENIWQFIRDNWLF